MGAWNRGRQPLAEVVEDHIMDARPILIKDPGTVDVDDQLIMP
jgi:hypothetical protein